MYIQTVNGFIHFQTDVAIDLTCESDNAFVQLFESKRKHYY